MSDATPIAEGTPVRLVPRRGVIENVLTSKIGRTKKTAETHHSYLVRYEDGGAEIVPARHLEIVEEAS